MSCRRFCDVEATDKRAIAGYEAGSFFAALCDLVCEPTKADCRQVQCAVNKDVTMTISSRNHSEVGFEIWEDGESWFWLVVSPHSDRGTIGAAPTEAEAIRAARSQIEDPSD